MRYRVRYTLEQWRKLAGLSQTELGKLVGKSYHTIRRWEKGQTAPTAKDITELEKVLNIKWSDDVILPKA